jgi:alpha-methylacyl-CoA racemase
LKLLEGLRVVSTALNLPGPVACARLRDLGATVAKIEPPSGDPFEQFCPAWYRRLHDGVTVGRLDLKSDTGQRAMARLIEGADLLVTAQRASALERMGLDRARLAKSYPTLCHVAITGHAPPDDELPGHDLTYLAAHGLVSPPHLPRTLFADMAGAERAVSTALALVVARARSGKGEAAAAPLADAARALAQPLHEGLTRDGALLGGGYAGYNLYASRTGWVAVAALEPRFEKRLAEKLALGALTVERLRELFASQDAGYWEEWARKNDLPIVAVRESLPPAGC